MALVTLNELGIRFHGPPLLDGISCQIEPGQRIGLLGRNGAGQVDAAADPLRPGRAGSRGRHLRSRRPRRRCCRRRSRKTSTGASARSSPAVCRRRRRARIGVARRTAGGTHPVAHGAERRGALRAPLVRDEAAGAAGPRAGGRTRPAAAGRADEPLGHRRHPVAGRDPGPLGHHADVRDPRPHVPAQAGRADPGTGPRPAVRLVLRLRHVPPAERGGAGRRRKAERAVRQEAGRRRRRGFARASRRGGPATKAACGPWNRCARERQERRTAARQRADGTAAGAAQRHPRRAGRGRRVCLRRAHRLPRPVDHHPARRQDRDHRAQRSRQDHPAPRAAGATAAHRRAASGWERTCRSPTSTNCGRSWSRTRRSRKTSPTATTSVRVGGQTQHVLGYLQNFLFPPERARTLVRFLSGGERNRLLLARLFAKPANVVVLDEPTNDLDAETLELLEDAAGRVRRDGAAGQPRPGVPEQRGHQHAGLRGRPGPGVRRRLRRLAAAASAGPAARRPGAGQGRPPRGARQPGRRQRSARRPAPAARRRANGG